MPKGIYQRQKIIYNCDKCKDRNWLISCECGCGNILLLRVKRGGKIRHYTNGHNIRGKPHPVFGERHPNWKGGRKPDNNDYILILSKGHPHGDLDGYVFEHRLVMEAHLDRYLESWEQVHHINRQKDDNRLENLQLTNRSDHMKIHMEEILLAQNKILRKK